MRDVSGKTAFITGGASGIGLALGRVFAGAGMNVMLADIESAALTMALEGFHDVRDRVCGVVCDVTDPNSVERAAMACTDAFGKVHVICNNAGVGGGSGIDEISVDDWRWVIDVNLMGVVHGIASFLPHIRGHGEGGHIVNTASWAGIQSGLGFSPYSASKFAVVNISEGLRLRLEPFGIGVTVLCPGFVQTRIMDAGRNRQERYGPWQKLDPASAAGQLVANLAEGSRTGMDPMDLAARVLKAVRDNELYVFTHPEWRAEAEQRFAAILAAVDRTPAR